MSYIPEKINLWFSTEVEIGDTEVIPSYPVDAENKKTNESAERWAENRSKLYQWNNGTRELASEAKVQKVTIENKPISRVRILKLELRGNGGRAWKGMLPDGHYIDVREDCMLEAITTDGIDPGGILRGKFIFAVVGSQMKLIKFGSELYNEIIATKELRQMPNIRVKDLVPGRAYFTRTGEKLYFIGFVKTAELDTILETRPVNSIYQTSRYVPHSITKRGKYQLWMGGLSKWSTEKTPRQKLESLKKKIKEYRDNGKHYLWISSSFYCLKSKAVVSWEECPPEEMVTIEEVRDLALEIPRAKLYKKRSEERNDIKYFLDTNETSRILLMCPYEKEWTCPEEYKPYL
jgi:hypothetical protein